MSDFFFVNANSLQDAARLVAADEKTITAAMRRAVSRVGRWAGSQVSRKVAKATKIRARVINSRMRVDIVNKDGILARVWAGLNPVELKLLKPRETRRGVTAGPAKIPGAFIVESAGGHVFKRAGKKRLPINKQPGIPVYEAGAPAVAEVAAEVGDRLLREFEHELQWRTSQK